MASGIEFTFEVDLSRFYAVLDKYPAEVSKATRQNLSVALIEVASYAKVNHNFHTRFGRLENALETEVAPDGLSGRIYIKKEDAPYGAAVHDGWRRTRPILPLHYKSLHWVKGGKDVFSRGIYKSAKKEPDKFLFKAFNLYLKQIVARLTKALTDAIKGVTV